jgi:hypothetical protein
MNLEQALIGIAAIGAAFGFMLAWSIALYRCDRHSDQEYRRGLAEGKRRRPGEYELVPVPAAPDPFDVTLNLPVELGPFDLPAALERLYQPPPGGEDSRETTLIRALLTAPVERIPEVFDGYRPPPPGRDQTWLRASVRQLINRAARRP